MRAPLHSFSLLTPACMALALVAAAQEQSAGLHRESNRLVKLLELPDKRGGAVRRLLALGAAAVPELTRGLSDPRIGIVRTIAEILRQLGSDAKAATTALTKLANGKDRERAFVARWALARIQRTGTTIIADYTKGAVVEFDAAGKKVGGLDGVGKVWNVERLANGHYLVCLLSKSTVQEVDRSGKVVWEYSKVKSPGDAERLPDGNTLITDYAAHRVIEVTPKGKIVWECEAKSAYDADRLANGNTLIADYSTHRVVEVNRKGETVWKYDKAKGVLDAERLPGGNTLLALYRGRSVIEIDPKGTTVWTLPLKFAPDCVFRLPNGNTLVGGQGGLREYDAKGKQVSIIAAGRVCSVGRY